MKAAMKAKTKTAIAAALLLTAGIAQAHVVLEQKTARAGIYYKATFMVGHGCEGSPTTGITIELPVAMAAVKPMPKPGWQLSTETMPPPQPMSLHGRAVEQVVHRVQWQGGNLADAHYDEFVMLLQLPAQAGLLHFKVLQQCVAGRGDWVEIPAAGGGRLRYPAAVLEVLPAAQQHHHH